MTGGGENRARKLGKAVGNDHFFEQPEDKIRHSRPKTRSVKAIDRPLSKLRHHLLVMKYGSCDQVGEIGHEQGVMKEPVFSCFAAVGIDKICDLREGEERNPEGENDLAKAVARVQCRIEAGEKEPSVLVIAEHDEIGDDGKGQRGAAHRLTPSLAAQYGPGRIIEKNRRDDQADICRVPPAIKEERRNDQPCHRSS